jgi:NADH-quinone oxidoreductase subunit A
MASAEFLLNYLPILLFMGIAIVMSVVMILGSMMLGKQNPDPEKLSAYECGFDAFSDARNKFDVRFYLVCLLFIIFDLEIAFLFPWAIALGDIGMLVLSMSGKRVDWNGSSLLWDMIVKL